MSRKPTERLSHNIMGAGGRQADLQRPGRASARAKARTHARADRGARKVGTLSFYKQKQLMLARVIMEGPAGRVTAAPWRHLFFIGKKGCSLFAPGGSLARTIERATASSPTHTVAAALGDQVSVALMMFRFTPNNIGAQTGLTGPCRAVPCRRCGPGTARRPGSRAGPARLICPRCPFNQKNCKKNCVQWGFEPRTSLFQAESTKCKRLTSRTLAYLL
jgi:hypothetical protein